MYFTFAKVVNLEDYANLYYLITLQNTLKNLLLS